MGLQKKAPIPSRLSGNKNTTTTVPANKTNTVTLFDINGTFNGSIVDLDEIMAENQRRVEEQRKLEQERLEQERIAEEQRILAEQAAEAQRKMEEEQALADKVAKEQEEQKNSITFFKTPSNEDFERLIKCYEKLPHTLTNIEVKNMRSSIEIDLDDEDWEELDLEAEFEGVAIEAKRDGTVQHFFNLPMQKDFVDAINANTETLKEKYETLKSRYIGTDENGHEIIIKPFDEEYQIEYNNIVNEEYDFLFGENSIIDMFENTLEEQIIKQFTGDDNPKDKEFKNEFKKLRKHLVIEVSTSNPTRVVTSIDRDSNGYIRKVNYKTINTNLNVTLKYPKKSGGDPKKLKTITVNLLDN